MTVRSNRSASTGIGGESLVDDVVGEVRSPICRRTATDADLDHTVAWNDGGTTSEYNLHAGCRHDHRLKTHAPDWTVIQDPDGTITYITPTGHRYTSQPHDYRPDPPPGGTSDPAPESPLDHGPGNHESCGHELSDQESDPPPF